MAAPAQTAAFGVMRPLIRVSLFDADSENDFTLLEDGGEYFVGFGDRTGTYREFVRTVCDDDDGALFRDLVTGDVEANFLAMMQGLAMRWGDEFTGEIVRSARRA